MSTHALRRLTGILLIIVPAGFTALFTLLQVLFEYPDILRRPTAEVLTRFAAGGPGLVAAWYGMTLSAVLFIPLALLLNRALAPEQTPPGLQIAAAFGVVAGLVQAIGFIRWPFLVPQLAQAYLDPTASEARRAAAAMVFEAFHAYAGMAIGEHLGYISTAAWTLLLALHLLRGPGFGRWLGLSGAALSLGLAAGLLEPIGVPLAGAVNAVSYLLWALWLIALGARLLAGRVA